MKTETCKNEGFTLIELLGVIAVIMVLVGLLVPAVMGAINRARITRMMNNGRNCYHAMMALVTDVGVNPYPGSIAYSTSTEVWKWMITNQYMDATFSVCSGHGLPVYNGGNAAIFTATNNAWCFVANINEQTRSATPLMFTRNLNISSLADTPYSLKLTDEAPLGKTGVIVVRMGGAVEFLRPAELDENFNPFSETNAVLRP